MQNQSNLIGSKEPEASFPTATVDHKIKLALFSSGLGIINRGFEVSTARIFRAIQSCADLDTRLFAGAEYPEAERVWCISRNRWLQSPLQWLPFVKGDKLWRLAYILEQTTFCFGLIRDSQQAWQPEVTWVKEVPLAHVLYEFRKLSGYPYKIVFANGGGFRPKTYQQFDFIQHLHQDAYEEALEFGIPAEKMNVLPNVIPYSVPRKSRSDLRREFGFSDSDWIVICVAAWNKYHKRVDYLIEEVARANIPNCKLIICGQPEPDADELKRLAADKLGERVRFFTVEEEKVKELLHMSDLFVLCSFYEGLGTVMIEAAMAGLPVISHPHGGSKFVLEDERWLLDMSNEGSLALKLQELHAVPPDPNTVKELQEQVRNRFDGRKISQAFQAMIKQVHASS
jgi:glycosyltransferase involved in cell wall biosynthesis